MNIQQLIYIVAVEEEGQFLKAADRCFVTPATLSMMIKKLEDELGLVIFDRSRQRIVTTPAGTQIVDKAKTILYHIRDLEQIAKSSTTEIAGELRMAVIPTLAPYLLHLFLPQLTEQYPRLHIRLFEWNTNQIISALATDKLDIGIAATPLCNAEISETPVFYEQLMVYSEIKRSAKKKYITVDEIDPEKLWLLEEDHCLRSQVMDLCSLKKTSGEHNPIEFEAGSIESLLRMVKINEGITVIPELAVHSLATENQQKISSFAAPVPVREISLLTYRHFAKTTLVNALADIIQQSVQPYLQATRQQRQILNLKIKDMPLARNTSR